MHGRSVDITVVGLAGEQNLLFAPRNKVFKPTLLEINNRSGVAARVRGWDTFTDSQGVAHTSAAVPIVLFDHGLAAGESISLDYMNKGKKAIGTIVVQSDQVPVTCGMWGDFE